MRKGCIWVAVVLVVAKLRVVPGEGCRSQPACDPKPVYSITRVKPSDLLVECPTAYLFTRAGDQEVTGPVDPPESDQDHVELYAVADRAKRDVSCRTSRNLKRGCLAGDVPVCALSITCHGRDISLARLTMACAGDFEFWYPTESSGWQNLVAGIQLACSGGQVKAVKRGKDHYVENCSTAITLFGDGSCTSREVPQPETVNCLVGAKVTTEDLAQAYEADRVWVYDSATATSPISDLSIDCPQGAPVWVWVRTKELPPGAPRDFSCEARTMIRKGACSSPPQCSGPVFSLSSVDQDQLAAACEQGVSFWQSDLVPVTFPLTSLPAVVFAVKNISMKHDATCRQAVTVSRGCPHKPHCTVHCSGNITTVSRAAEFCTDLVDFYQDHVLVKDTLNCSSAGLRAVVKGQPFERENCYDQVSFTTGGTCSSGPSCLSHDFYCKGPTASLEDLQAFCTTSQGTLSYVFKHDNGSNPAFDCPVKPGDPPLSIWVVQQSKEADLSCGRMIRLKRGVCQKGPECPSTVYAAPTSITLAANSLLQKCKRGRWLLRGDGTPLTGSVQLGLDKFVYVVADHDGVDSSCWTKVKIEIGCTPAGPDCPSTIHCPLSSQTISLTELRASCDEADVRFFDRVTQRALMSASCHNGNNTVLAVRKGASPDVVSCSKEVTLIAGSCQAGPVCPREFWCSSSQDHLPASTLTGVCQELNPKEPANLIIVNSTGSTLAKISCPSQPDDVVRVWAVMSSSASSGDTSCRTLLNVRKGACDASSWCAGKDGGPRTLLCTGSLHLSDIQAVCRLPQDLAVFYREVGHMGRVLLQPHRPISCPLDEKELEVVLGSVEAMDPTCTSRVIIKRGCSAPPKCLEVIHCKANETRISAQDVSQRSCAPGVDVFVSAGGAFQPVRNQVDCPTGAADVRLFIVAKGQPPELESCRKEITLKKGSCSGGPTCKKRVLHCTPEWPTDTMKAELATNCPGLGEGDFFFPGGKDVPCPPTHDQEIFVLARGKEGVAAPNDSSCSTLLVLVRGACDIKPPLSNKVLNGVLHCSQDITLKELNEMLPPEGYLFYTFYTDLTSDSRMSLSSRIPCDVRGRTLYVVAGANPVVDESCRREVTIKRGCDLNNIRRCAARITLPTNVHVVDLRAITQWCPRSTSLFSRGDDLQPLRAELARPESDVKIVAVAPGAGPEVDSCTYEVTLTRGAAAHQEPPSCSINITYCTEDMDLKDLRAVCGYRGEGDLAFYDVRSWSGSGFPRVMDGVTLRCTDSETIVGVALANITDPDTSAMTALRVVRGCPKPPACVDVVYVGSGPASLGAQDPCPGEPRGVQFYSIIHETVSPITDLEGATIRKLYVTFTNTSITLNSCRKEITVEPATCGGLDSTVMCSRQILCLVDLTLSQMRSRCDGEEVNFFHAATFEPVEFPLTCPSRDMETRLVVAPTTKNVQDVTCRQEVTVKRGCYHRPWCLEPSLYCNNQQQISLQELEANCGGSSLFDYYESATKMKLDSSKVISCSDGVAIVPSTSSRRSLSQEDSISFEDQSAVRGESPRQAEADVSTSGSTGSAPIKSGQTAGVDHGEGTQEEGGTGGTATGGQPGSSNLIADQKNGLQPTVQQLGQQESTKRGGGQQESLSSNSSRSTMELTLLVVPVGADPDDPNCLFPLTVQAGSVPDTTTRSWSEYKSKLTHDKCVATPNMDQACVVKPVCVPKDNLGYASLSCFHKQAVTKQDCDPGCTYLPDIQHFANIEYRRRVKKLDRMTYNQHRDKLSRMISPSPSTAGPLLPTCVPSGVAACIVKDPVSCALDPRCTMETSTSFLDSCMSVPEGRCCGYSKEWCKTEARLAPNDQGECQWMETDQFLEGGDCTYVPASCNDPLEMYKPRCGHPCGLCNHCVTTVIHDQSQDKAELRALVGNPSFGVLQALVRSKGLTLSGPKGKIRPAAVCRALGLCLNTTCQVLTDTNNAKLEPVDYCSSSGGRQDNQTSQHHGQLALREEECLNNVDAGAEAQHKCGGARRVCDFSMSTRVEKTCDPTTGVDRLVPIGMCKAPCELPKNIQFKDMVNSVVRNCTTDVDCGDGESCEDLPGCVRYDCQEETGLVELPCDKACLVSVPEVNNEAQFDASGSSILLTLLTPARTAAFPCSSVFMNAIPLGSRAWCQASGSVLTARLAGGPTIEPGDTLDLKSDQSVLRPLIGDKPFFGRNIKVVICERCLGPEAKIQGPLVFRPACSPRQSALPYQYASTSWDPSGRPLRRFTWSTTSKLEDIRQAVEAANVRLNRRGSPYLLLPAAANSLQGNISITLEVENFMGLVDTQTITVTGSWGSIPSIAIQSLRTTFKTSEDLRLEVEPSQCGPAYYSWTSVPEIASLTNTYDRSIFVAKEELLPLASYTFTVQAFFVQSQTQSAPVSVTLKRVPSDLVVDLRGPNGDLGRRDTLTQIILDASGSFDPDDVSGQRPLQFIWGCRRDDFPQACFKDGDFTGAQSAGGVWTIQTDQLQAGRSYTFTVTVVKDDRTGSASLTVHYMDRAVPGGVITRFCTFSPLTGRAHPCPAHHKPDTDLTLVLTPDSGSETSAVQWSAPGLTLTTDNSEGLTQRTLRIRSVALAQVFGSLRVQAQLTAADGTVGVQSITVPLNSPPTCGQPSGEQSCVEASSLTGTYPGNSSITLRANGWVDAEGDVLMYEYGEVDNQGRLLQHFFGPRPWFTFNSLTPGRHKLYACARDSAGARGCNAVEVQILRSSSAANHLEALAGNITVGEKASVGDFFVAAGELLDIYDFVVASKDNAMTAVAESILVKVHVILLLMTNVGVYTRDPDVSVQEMMLASRLIEAGRNLDADAAILLLGSLQITLDVMLERDRVMTPVQAEMALRTLMGSFRLAVGTSADDVDREGGRRLLSATEVPDGTLAESLEVLLQMVGDTANLLASTVSLGVDPVFAGHAEDICITLKREVTKTSVDSAPINSAVLPLGCTSPLVTITFPDAYGASCRSDMECPHQQLIRVMYLADAQLLTAITAGYPQLSISVGMSVEVSAVTGAVVVSLDYHPDGGKLCRSCDCPMKVRFPLGGSTYLPGHKVYCVRLVQATSGSSGLLQAEIGDVVTGDVVGGAVECTTWHQGDMIMVMQDKELNTPAPPPSPTSRTPGIPATYQIRLKYDWDKVMTDTTLAAKIRGDVQLAMYICITRLGVVLGELDRVSVSLNQGSVIATVVVMYPEGTSEAAIVKVRRVFRDDPGTFFQGTSLEGIFLDMDPQQDQGLSQGDLAGIVIGSVVCAGLLVAALLWLQVKVRRARYDVMGQPGVAAP